jgi:hypothetical protein
MAKKPAIPAVNFSDAAVSQAISALKENVEIITGARGGEIGSLASGASNTDIISKINEIIVKLNVSG